MNQQPTFEQQYMDAKAASGEAGNHTFLSGNVDAQAVGARILQTALDNGVRAASGVVERVLTEIPDDALPQARGLRFRVVPTADGTQVGRLEMGWQPHDIASDRIYDDGARASEYRPVHPNTLSQLSGQVRNLTLPYIRGLVESGEEWQHRLAERILADHFGHDSARYLVRTIGGDRRALLSNSYRRLDSRPLLEAFVTACKDVGALPYDGRGGDVRSIVRVLVPQVFNVGGDVFALGLTWQNSDYGCGAYGITGFILRLLCVNGAMQESELRQIHLGRKLDDAEIFSSKTYELDTKTMASATTDIVRGLLSPKGLDLRVAMVREAAERQVEFAQAVRPVAERLTKAEREKAKEAFEGRDDYNLPPGRTLWRASNALSWIAKEATPDRADDLESMAGKLLSPR